MTIQSVRPEVPADDAGSAAGAAEFVPVHHPLPRATHFPPISSV